MAYDLSVRYFAESCSKIFVDEIERKDLLKFAAFLRDEKEQAPRTCWNKFANIMSFLKDKVCVVWSERMTGRDSWKRNLISTRKKN